MAFNNKKLEEATIILEWLFPFRRQWLVAFISSETSEALWWVSNELLEESKLDIPTKPEDIKKYHLLNNIERNFLTIWYQENEYEHDEDKKDTTSEHDSGKEEQYWNDNKLVPINSKKNNKHKTLLEKDLIYLCKGKILKKDRRAWKWVYYQVNMETCEKIKNAISNFR